MILTKNNTLNLQISEIKRFIDNENKNKYSFFSLAAKVKNKLGHKNIYYNNSLSYRELFNLLEELSEKNKGDLDEKGIINFQFIIIGKHFYNEIRIKTLVDTLELQEGTTYSGVFCYNGNFQLPNKKYLQHNTAFLTFLKERSQPELEAFVKVKQLRIKNPNEINYWDFLIDDSDEDLALLTFDNSRNEIYYLSDNFIKNAKYPAIEYSLVSASPKQNSNVNIDSEKEIISLYG